ncbi:MAG TPA: hypothetical protein VI942_01700, partial [Thermoanaerobaculia bacterium]|nr:hypothetical protein [Thermoanaerobaculia bacterium]
LGAVNTAIATTINDAGATTTVFIVTSATNIAVGSILFVGAECRPVTVVSGTTITVGVPFSAAPANGATVKGITYKCADAVAEGLDVYNYDGQSNLNRVAEGVVINSGTFQIDTRARILSMVLSGLAKDVSTSSITSKPTGVTIGTPIAASFGDVWIGSTAFSLFDISIVVNNNDTRRMIPVGSQNADGISRGLRDVSVTFRLYLDATTAGLYADAVARTSKSLFVQIGNTAGYIWGFWLPTFVLQTPDPEFGDGDVIIEFSGSVAYGTGNNEIFIGHN